MRGRNQDGSWSTPFNPYKWGDAFTEGNALHYSWSVMQDVQGLADLMRDITIPNGLGAVGYDEGDVDGLVEGTLKQQRLLATAPREVTEDDAAAILRGSLEIW